MAERPIIDWSDWTQSPPGQYVLAWEQAQADRVVSDMFGYRAVQLGLPQLDALRENRMPSRVLTLDPQSPLSSPYLLPPTRPGADRLMHAGQPPLHGQHGHHVGGREPRRRSGNAILDAQTDVPLLHAPPNRTTVWADFGELPYESQSLDLLVMPHTLEFTVEPHALLREAERVLVPEGKLVITAFNSLSLWGVRQSVGRRTQRPFVPADTDLIAFTRLKDWIKLLGFELSRGRFGCYRPPLTNAKWLERCRFMEAAGDRWWPIFGAVYLITAVKRERRMRLVGPSWKKKTAAVPSALTPAAAPTPTSASRL
ncbi:class I SAM-dependent methyltransferase [Robbsia andropogonis]|uniref:class I SAM-dependent methyltransferase n=1 Tax=Robbsia andropogonis TaxID=28092 RepID=UPI0004656379|nr:methyltransferase domain-containing protein [Robbsia andropogonis]MCP1119787.1 class I SAM-dependent methyltransferase [Robbsia andropogonis]MCP1128820.1 class I SAM-dependent methyltransferase [Robbsia andropogonis]